MESMNKKNLMIFSFKYSNAIDYEKPSFSSCFDRKLTEMDEKEITNYY